MSTVAEVNTSLCALVRRVPQDSLAWEVQAQTGGRWACWYGHATWKYRAMPRAPYPWWGWVDADTPQQLAARIAAIDARYGLGRRP